MHSNTVGDIGKEICAICISKDSETWSIEDIPFFNYTDGWKPFLHERTRERVRYLAERRNRAVERALQEFPATQHILMIDSYYLHQVVEISRLIEKYRIINGTSEGASSILGASTWVLDKTRIRPKRRFYDNWTTPEAAELKLEDAASKGGNVRVRSVGGCYLYPLGVWRQYGYKVPEDLHGCEHNWLCEHSGMSVFLSLDERLWHDPVVYSVPKRIRMSLHLGRFFDKRNT